MRETLLGQLELTSAEMIQKQVAAARPLDHPAAAARLVSRWGATHYHGRYHLTEQPFLLEGCEALRKLGCRVVKLWFNRELPGYGFNSKWELPADATLVDVARHPYFRQCFDLPFETFVLEVLPLGRRRLWEEPDQEFRETERQFHDLTRYLLETYRRRSVTFILQHWEGDWMMRDYPGQSWVREVPADTAERYAAMRRWLAARQRGVMRARAESPATQARVYHAAEVNRVLDSLQGIPTVTTEVLPHVALDMISWSCYDGVKDLVAAWHGVEIIRQLARHDPGGKAPPVFVGEIGLPENGRKEEEVRTWWNDRLAVFLALDVPYVIHWQLYCNEPLKGVEHVEGRGLHAEELRGFWLIRPDGSLSFAGRFFDDLLRTSRDRQGAAAVR